METGSNPLNKSLEVVTSLPQALINIIVECVPDFQLTYEDGKHSYHKTGDVVGVSTAIHIWVTGTFTIDIKTNFSKQLETINGPGRVILTGSMIRKFSYCRKFIGGNCDEWDTSAVTDMSFMFADARKFEGCLSDWNTSKVTNMTHMFDGARRFKGCISDWDTSKVTNMAFMFSYCRKFDTQLKWDTENVTDMTFMFRKATKFRRQLIWSTPNCISMSSMFEDSFGSLFSIVKTPKKTYIYKIKSPTKSP